MSSSSVSYLRPELVKQIDRLDLKAKVIVEGFISGLHRSPYHGFSVEFAEHRKYEYGDDLQNIDWSVYAKTDRLYIKKYKAETNTECHLLLDISESMAFKYKSDLTKLDYSICIAAALGYLMIRQSDPVGAVTFSDRVRNYVQPKSKKSHFYSFLKALAGIKPGGTTNLMRSLDEASLLIRKRGLVLIFSDFLQDIDQFSSAIHQLSYYGHDVVLFHVLDNAEVGLPYNDLIIFKNPETGEKVTTDAPSIRGDYTKAVKKYIDELRDTCIKFNAEYVFLDTSTSFDKALMSFVMARSRKA